MKNWLIKFALLIAPVFVVTCALLMHAQDSTQNLQGYSGQVQILPNHALHLTTLVYTSPVKLTTNSNQIVFVLQSEQDIESKPWSGPARLLVGRGTVIVVPAANEKDHQGWNFKFATDHTPLSVSTWPLETYDVFGIARYGESTPLLPDQIYILSRTGHLPVSSK